MKSSDLLQKASWEMIPAASKEAIKRLLQFGKTPRQIEAEIIGRKYSHLPKWKRKEITEMYYLAADYALKNNLHLD